MKAFIAYRFTGEEPEQLGELLARVRDKLKEAEVEAYCTFFDEASFKDKSYGAKQIMEHAFAVIDKSDMLLIIQTSENKSEGMLMEAGYCLAKGIPIVAAVKKGVTATYVPQIADRSFEWTDLEDFQKKIEAFDFPSVINT